MVTEENAKDLKEGQEVFVLDRDMILPYNILKGKIIKHFPSSKRFKVEFDFNKIFSHSELEREHLVVKFRNYNEIFENLQEAYQEGIQIFDKRISSIEISRQSFIGEVQKLNSEVTRNSSHL